MKDRGDRSWGKYLYSVIYDGLAGNKNVCVPWLTAFAFIIIKSPYESNQDSCLLGYFPWS